MLSYINAIFKNNPLAGLNYLENELYKEVINDVIFIKKIKPIQIWEHCKMLGIEPARVEWIL